MSLGIAPFGSVLVKLVRTRGLFVLTGTPAAAVVLTVTAADSRTLAAIHKHASQVQLL
jgi:hypothetical protein